jgi:hypothetical protein
VFWHWAASIGGRRWLVNPRVPKGGFVLKWLKLPEIQGLWGSSSLDLRSWSAKMPRDAK